MTKLLIVVVIAWLGMWVFAFGHAVNNPKCMDRYGKLSEGCGMGVLLPFTWPFYVSWAFQQRSVTVADATGGQG